MADVGARQPLALNGISDRFEPRSGLLNLSMVLHCSKSNVSRLTSRPPHNTAASNTQDLGKSPRMRTANPGTAGVVASGIHAQPRLADETQPRKSTKFYELDDRMPAPREMIDRTYPGSDEWRSRCNPVDPEQVFTSDASRRVRLAG